jgi:hypothetical protein
MRFSHQFNVDAKRLYFSIAVRNFLQIKVYLRPCSRAPRALGGSKNSSWPPGAGWANALDHGGQNAVLRQARLLAEHVRQKLSAPTSAVTERVVVGLADLLQEARVFRQNKLARARAELDAACAEVNAEAARIREIFATTKAYIEARKALHRALAAHK